MAVDCAEPSVPRVKGEASGCRVWGAGRGLPRAHMACTNSPPGGSMWHRCLVPAGASSGQRKGTVQPKGRRWTQRGPTDSVEVEEVRSLGALSSGVGVGCQECQGHQAPTSCQHWQGWGRGENQGVGTHNLWSQADIQFELCTVHRFAIPFFFGLWHWHK